MTDKKPVPAVPPIRHEVDLKALYAIADVLNGFVMTQESPSEENIWLKAFFFHMDKSMASGGDPTPDEVTVRHANDFASLVVEAYKTRFPVKEDGDDDDDEPVLPKGKNPLADEEEEGG